MRRMFQGPLLLAIVLTAGCGGDSGESRAESTPAATSAAPAPSPTPPNCVTVYGTLQRDLAPVLEEREKRQITAVDAAERLAPSIAFLEEQESIATAAAKPDLAKGLGKVREGVLRMRVAYLETPDDVSLPESFLTVAFQELDKACA